MGSRGEGCSRREFLKMTAGMVAIASTGLAPAAERRVAFESRENLVQIRVEDQPLATYVYHDAEILRPYFKDVYAPGGVRVTRHHPPRAGIDPADHATMHPGLWLAFGDLGGADFWRNKGTVEHGGFIRPPQVDGDKGTFTVRNRYLAGGTTICEETCTYTFRVRPAGYLILWDSTFQSPQSGFYFDDQEEMGLGVRVATPLMVKPQDSHSRPGRILDDHGRRNEKGTWGEQAAWCDYSGWTGDTFAGIMVMPDPRHATACRWHTRDYGLMVANPFGRSVFRKGPAHRTEVLSGQPFHLCFGILLHAGSSEDSFDAAAAYQDFLKDAARVTAARYGCSSPSA